MTVMTAAHAVMVTIALALQDITTYLFSSNVAFYTATSNVALFTALDAAHAANASCSAELDAAEAELDQLRNGPFGGAVVTQRSLIVHLVLLIAHILLVRREQDTRPTTSDQKSQTSLEAVGRRSEATVYANHFPLRRAIAMWKNATSTSPHLTSLWWSCTTTATVAKADCATSPDAGSVLSSRFLNATVDRMLQNTKAKLHEQERRAQRAEEEVERRTQQVNELTMQLHQSILRRVAQDPPKQPAEAPTAAPASGWQAGWAAIKIKSKEKLSSRSASFPRVALDFLTGYPTSRRNSNATNDARGPRAVGAPPPPLMLHAEMAEIGPAPTTRAPQPEPTSGVLSPILQENSPRKEGARPKSPPGRLAIRRVQPAVRPDSPLTRIKMLRV